MLRYELKSEKKEFPLAVKDLKDGAYENNYAYAIVFDDFHEEDKSQIAIFCKNSDNKYINRLSEIRNSDYQHWKKSSFSITFSNKA